jgi:large exoprotein involved in heme utilization and adhesion
LAAGQNFTLSDGATVSASSSGPGNAGDIAIAAGAFTIAQGAVVNSGTTSTGAGGAISVHASDNISIAGTSEDGTPSGVLSQTTGTVSGAGTGGNISLTAGQNLTLSDGATVSASSSGPGSAGDIAITAGALTISQGGVVDSGTTSTGDGGAINVTTAGNLSMSGISGGVFSRTTGTEPGSGAGGSISLMAGQNFTLSEGATVSASSDGPGNAGAIGITAGALTISQGGVVDSGTTSTGAGGAIIVNASGNMSISGTSGGVFSRTTGPESGSGAGGTIALMAGQNFTLSDGATVSASSSGPANAGNITIGANDTILIDKATVTTDATQASGGNIKLTANDTIQLVDSTIESSVQGDVTTAGGDISLDPDFIILQNSQILAKAVEGQGGNISLVANDVVLVDPFSLVDASASEGISGSVDIQAPTKVLSGTIVPLPQDPAPVTNLYGTKCVAGAGGHFSTFVDSKADSLAPTPGTFLASPFLPLLSSSQVAGSGHVGTLSGVSGTSQAPHLQLAAYSPPVLFGHGYEMLTACP